jgi:non-canonical (house-cleaning) NTP pyrophosphatase
MNTVRVAVASMNPVKLSATRIRRFMKAFPGQRRSQVEGVRGCSSGVADQPKTDEETLTGAENRARTLADGSNADFCVGIEGGIERTDRGVEAFAWVVVERNGITGQESLVQLRASGGGGANSSTPGSSSAMPTIASSGRRIRSTTRAPWVY